MLQHLGVCTPYVVPVLPPCIHTRVLLAVSKRQTAPSHRAPGMMESIPAVQEGVEDDNLQPSCLRSQAITWRPPLAQSPQSVFLCP